MAGGRNPSNRDLMDAIIAISNRQTEDRVLLSTLRDSFVHRRERAQRFEDDTRVKLTEIQTRQADIRRRVKRMEPVVERWNRRDIVRRALARCVMRWWKTSAAIAAAAAAVVAWLNDWVPKLGKLLKLVRA